MHIHGGALPLTNRIADGARLKNDQMPILHAESMFRLHSTCYTKSWNQLFTIVGLEIGRS